MYQYHNKYLFTCFLLIILGSKAFGQTSTVSDPLSTRENAPYSRFGLGEQWDGNNAELRGMGSMSSAYESSVTINTDNPASYSFLARTTYEAGTEASFRNLNTSTASYGTGTATLSYLNIGVPVGKNGGLCLGVRPQTHIYYNLSDTSNTLIGNTASFYKGTGGLNYAFIGAAYKYKGFSIGFNFGYLFGNINTTDSLENIDTARAYNSSFIHDTRIGGLYYKLGVMYEGKLSSKYSIRIGGTATLQQDVNAWKNEYWIGTFLYSDTVSIDTAYQANQQHGKIAMPLSYSFGVQLMNSDKWMLGIDYSATQWSQYRSFDVPDSLTNSYKVSLGGQFTPNATALHNYWSHVTYRLGLYYGVNEVYLDNTKLNFYGITVGGSLPFNRSTDQVHLAFDIGRLGTTANNLIQETYVRFTLGLSLNQQWFIKRKYD